MHKTTKKQIKAKKTAENKWSLKNNYYFCSIEEEGKATFLSPWTGADMASIQRRMAAMTLTC